MNGRSVLRAVGVICIPVAVVVASSGLAVLYGPSSIWACAAPPAAALGCLLGILRMPGRLARGVDSVPHRGGDDGTGANAGTAKPRLCAHPWLVSVAAALVRVTGMLFAQFVAGPLATCWQGSPWRDPLSALALGWRASFGAFGLLVGLEPPVGRTDGAPMAVWTLCLWSAFLATSLARSGTAWARALTALPVMAQMAICALLGLDSSAFPFAAAGMAVALLLLIRLPLAGASIDGMGPVAADAPATSSSASAQTDDPEHATPGPWASMPRLGASVAAPALAAVLAMAVCPSAVPPSHRLVLRDMVDPPYSAADRSSPLSGLRLWPTQRHDDVLLTVEGLPAGTPVRLAVMDRFDGNVWNLSDSSGTGSSSAFTRPGPSIAQTERGRTFRATFTLGKGWDDVWLPLAGAVTRVDFDETAHARRLHVNAATDTALLADGLEAGTRYVESGVLPPVPDERSVGRATNGKARLPQATSVPRSVSRMAAAIAGGERTAGAKARALADHLSSRGWFSHGGEDEYPSLPGHGSRRIDELLDERGEMVGDGEQYASAMALMARELGLSSRVVMGFLPTRAAADDKGTADGDVIRFTGADMTAWVEVHLAGLGWVAFDPTPPDSRAPDPERPLSAASPRQVVRQPRPPLNDLPEEETRPKGRSSAVGGDAAEVPDPSSIWRRLAPVVGKAALFGMPVWLLALSAAMILAIKARMLARARSRGSPKDRIENGWKALLDMAADAGLPVPAAMTRAEQATLLAHPPRAEGGRRRRRPRGGSKRRRRRSSPHAPDIESGIDANDLHALAERADLATFSSAACPPGDAEEYWRMMLETRRALLRAQPWTRRWRAALAVRPPRRRRTDPHTL